MLVGRYRDLVIEAVGRLEGHVASTKGDGLLAVFGYPAAHEDDARRAVLAGLQIVRNVAKLGEQAQRRLGLGVNVRVGIHRGLVYLDTEQDDVYGLGANLAARVSGLAQPGTVVVSDAVERLVRNAFELEARPAAPVKGVDHRIAHHQVLGERLRPTRIGGGLLVGRDTEVGQLKAAWERAKAGTLSPTTIVLRGEAGIGKSRLASAAVEFAELSGGQVLELAGSPFHSDVGLHPIRVLLEQRCGIGRLTEPVDRLSLLDAELRSRSLDPAGLIALLAPAMGIGEEAGYQPVAAEGDELYELIDDAVRRYLSACLGDAGLVVAEDVQWFDSSTIETVGALADQADGRVLVVVTSRDGKWLPDGRPVEVIDLAPLTDEHAEELIAALDPDLPAHDRAAVRDRCDGMPFFIEQVVTGLPDAADGFVVPEALYEPLFARLRASPNVLPLVEAAAVIGRDVDRALFLAVCDLDESQIDAVIDELLDALVFEPSGPDGWRFRHELLREVAGEVTPPSVRRGLHARVADALAATASGDPDWCLIAGHHERATQFAQAADAYLKATDNACLRGALEEARGYLTRALAGLECETPGPDRDRIEMSVRLRRGSLTAATVGAAVYLEDYERCLELGGTDLGDDELITTLLSVVGYYNVRADLDRCVTILESLRVGLGSGRDWFRHVIDANFAIVDWLRGKFDSAAKGLAEAAAGMTVTEPHRVDAVRHSDTIVAAHLHMAFIHAIRGDLMQAEAELGSANRRVDQLGLPRAPFVRAHALSIESMVCAETGRLPEAKALATDILQLSERYGLDTSRLTGTTQLVAVRALMTLTDTRPDQARLSEHIAALTASLDERTVRGVNLYRTYFDAVNARLFTAVGDHATARRLLDTALRLAEETGMHYYDTELLRLRAHTQEDAAARQADLSAARDLARRQGAPLFELRAALDEFHFRGAAARAAVADALGRLPADTAVPERQRALLMLGGEQT